MRPRTVEARQLGSFCCSMASKSLVWPNPLREVLFEFHQLPSLWFSR